MRLIISRRQDAKKGLMGAHKGVVFTLAYRLELTTEEAELVREYKLEDYPLTWTEIQGQPVPDATIRRLLDGRSQSVNDVTTLLNSEQVIKEACDVLPPLFEVVRSFGGDEVIEYPRVNAAVSSPAG